MKDNLIYKLEIIWILIWGIPLAAITFCWLFSMGCVRVFSPTVFKIFSSSIYESFKKYEDKTLNNLTKNKMTKENRTCQVCYNDILKNGKPVTEGRAKFCTPCKKERIREARKRYKDTLGADFRPIPTVSSLGEKVKMPNFSYDDSEKWDCYDSG